MSVETFFFLTLFLHCFKEQHLELVMIKGKRMNERMNDGRMIK